MASYLQRGRPINGQSREIIFNVYKYFETEAQKFKNLYVDGGNYFLKIQERVAKATGISRKSVSAILQEAEKEIPPSTFQFKTPTKGRKKKPVTSDGSTQPVENKHCSKLKIVKTERQIKQEKLQKDISGPYIPNESLSFQNMVNLRTTTNDTMHDISTPVHTSLHNNAESRQTNQTSQVLSVPMEVSEHAEHLSKSVMVKTETQNNASAGAYIQVKHEPTYQEDCQT